MGKATVDTSQFWQALFNLQKSIWTLPLRTCGGSLQEEGGKKDVEKKLVSLDTVIGSKGMVSRLAQEYEKGV